MPKVDGRGLPPYDQGPRHSHSVLRDASQHSVRAPRVWRSGRGDVPVQLSPALVVGTGPGMRARFHLKACLIGAFLVRNVLANRGLQHISWILGRVFGEDNYVIFRVFDNRHVKVYLGDGYWIAPLLRLGDYEPEVRRVLSRVLRADCALIDCGANIGWWSVYASTRVASSDKILAVEASATTFGRLRENARLNGNAFTCVHAAIWNRSSRRLTVHYHPDRHAGASLKQRRSGRLIRRAYLREAVVSLTLDDLVDQRLGAPEGPVILKLDVEGAEMQALEGGSRLLDTVSLIIYEDHARDTSCSVSRDIMAKGFRVFYCDDSFRLQMVPDGDSVQIIKRQTKRGYNFFACRDGSDMFHELAKWCE